MVNQNLKGEIREVRGGGMRGNSGGVKCFKKGEKRGKGDEYAEGNKRGEIAVRKRGKVREKGGLKGKKDCGQISPRLRETLKNVSASTKIPQISSSFSLIFERFFH